MAKYIAQHKRKKRIGNRLTRKLLVLLLVTMVLFASTVWGATARYVHHSEGAALVKVREFYFTSDYLAPGGAKHTLNPGTTAVTFELRNYDGLKVSELSIDYSVTKNGEQVASGTLPAGTETTVPVTLNGLTPGTYTVAAQGTNGFYRTLSATFEVKAGNEGIYKHTENYDDYVLVTVWTQGRTGEAAITIPSGVIPDYTDTALAGKSAGGTVTVSLGADASRSYRFFTTGNYEKAPVTVTAGGEALEETGLN